MDALTLTGGFAAITGLMADFASARGHKDVLEVRDFLDWLRFHGHTELLDRIETNTAVSVGIKASFAEGRAELLEKLSSIEKLIGALTIGLGPLHELALAVRPDLALSQQSVAILAAYESAKAGKALLVTSFDGTNLVFLDGGGSAGFDPIDDRFFEADLDELVSLQLLALSFNDSGSKVFHMTRRGSAVANSLA